MHFILYLLLSILPAKTRAVLVKHTGLKIGQVTLSGKMIRRSTQNSHRKMH